MMANLEACDLEGSPRPMIEARDRNPEYCGRIGLDSEREDGGDEFSPMTLTSPVGPKAHANVQHFWLAHGIIATRNPSLRAKAAVPHEDTAFVDHRMVAVLRRQKRTQTVRREIILRIRRIVRPAGDLPGIYFVEAVNAELHPFTP
jgi:hypothetical protein